MKAVTTGWLEAAAVSWLPLSTLRTAHHEEVSEILRLKTAMTEVRKLLDQPLEEIDESYDEPGPQEVNPEDLGVAMEAENESVTCMLHGKGLSQEKNRSALLSEELRFWMMYHLA